MRNDKRCGFEIVTARDIDRIGTEGVIKKLKERVKGSRVYISVDIDVLDPAFAPGEFGTCFNLRMWRANAQFEATGTAEVGGWSTRELLTILDGLEGMEIIGADIGKQASWMGRSRVTGFFC